MTVPPAVADESGRAGDAGSLSQQSADTEFPPVTIYMTVLDEERHLAEVVEHAQTQDYPGELQIVVAVGPCSDGTRGIAERLAEEDPRIVVVDNPSGYIAAGLNRALAAAQHEIVVRVDGHAMLPPGYVSEAVATLRATGADNVGGIMAAEGETDFERAVACAMRSPIGVGRAAFHTGGEPGEALTVYLGAFRREAQQRAGGYDESMLRAEDWELNHRIRSNGGLVWFNPRMQVSYRPRPNLRMLARQYFFYGQWRREITRRHRETVSLRYLAPPVLVSILSAGTLAGTAGTLGGPRWLRAGWLAPLGYAGALLVGSAVTGRDLPWRIAAKLPAVYATMHCAWGVGFLTSPADLSTRDHGRAVR